MRLIVLAPKVNHPTARLATLDFRFEALATEQFDERRRQKRRQDDESFLRFERLDAMEDFGERFLAALKQ